MFVYELTKMQVTPSVELDQALGKWQLLLNTDKNV